MDGSREIGHNLTVSQLYKLYPDHAEWHCPACGSTVDPVNGDFGEWRWNGWQWEHCHAGEGLGHIPCVKDDTDGRSLPDN